MPAPLRPQFRPVKTAFSASLLALALGLSILSCAEPESFEAESYLDSLITKTEHRAISALPEGGEIKPGTITPVPGKNSHAGMRSALLMPPMSEVVYTIPEDIGQSTYLKFATGVDYSSYVGGEGAEVRFVMLLRGEPVFHANVPFDQALPEIQRRWEEGEIPLAGGGKLVLRVEGDGDGVEQVKCGFAELSVIICASAINSTHILK